MSHAGQTLHYQLPQYEGTDIINPLVDTNDAYEKIDEAIYNVADAAATAVQTANEVKEDIEGTGGVDSRISALVTRMDAVETKNVEQDTSILGVQQALATTNGNVATNTQNISDLNTTVQGHTTSISNLSTRVQACENADTALDVRVTALENAPTPSMPTAADVSYSNTSSGLSATDVQSAIDEVSANEGDLTSLTTTDKSSLVAAINEVAGSGSLSLESGSCTFTNIGSDAKATDTVTFSGTYATAPTVLVVVEDTNVNGDSPYINAVVDSLTTTGCRIIIYNTSTTTVTSATVKYIVFP